MFRIGFGTDSHVLKDNSPLILGGITIPHDKGLVSHSDGDVVVHSMIDAILGAACQGDIGEHFPDSNTDLKGISSIVLLEKTLEKITGFEIVNIDVTIIAQKPNLKIYKKGMKHKLSEILNIDPNRINIKAKTTEGMGFEGREEGITAHTICLLKVQNEQ